MCFVCHLRESKFKIFSLFLIILTSFYLIACLEAKLNSNYFRKFLPCANEQLKLFNLINNKNAKIFRLMSASAIDYLDFSDSNLKHLFPYLISGKSCSYCLRFLIVFSDGFHSSFNHTQTMKSHSFKCLTILCIGSDDYSSVT